MSVLMLAVRSVSNSGCCKMPEFWRRSLLFWLTVLATISIVGCTNTDEPKDDSAVVRPAVPMWGLRMGMHVTEFDANANGLTFERMISYGKSPTYSCKIAGDDKQRLLVTFTNDDNDGLRLKEIAKVDRERTAPDLSRPDVSPVKLDGLYFGMKLKEFDPASHGLEVPPELTVKLGGHLISTFRKFRLIDDHNVEVFLTFNEGYISTDDQNLFRLTEVESRSYLKQMPESIKQFYSGEEPYEGGGQF